MTTAAILPDGSVIVRRPDQVVQLDAKLGLINLRAPAEREEFGGTLLASFESRVADRLRLVREAEDRFHLYLDLDNGKAIDLGISRSHTAAMRIAWAISDITRAEVWVEETSTDFPDTTSEDEPTTPIPIVAESPRSAGAAAAVTIAEEAETPVSPWTPPVTEVDLAAGPEASRMASFLGGSAVGAATVFPPDFADDHFEEPDALDNTFCRTSSDEERAVAVPHDEAETREILS